MKKIATVLLSTCMLFAGGATLSGCGGHEHNFKTEWSTSISNHWHECECGEKKDNAEHNWKLFETINNTTHKKTCDCGASVTEEHNWNGGEITIFPTATTNGERTYTCTSCEQTKTEQISATTELVLTKSDLQMLFKTVAQNLWFNLDAGNPAAGATPLSVNLQTDFVEITDPAELKVLKADAATFTALVNMIGDYYANENFIVSDKALTFIVNATHLSSQGTMDIELTILPVVDVQNNKITLEMLMVMPDLTTMYYNFDIDYNFVGTKNVTGFNMLVIQNKSSYIQQKMQDQKFYAVKTFTTAQKSAANQLQTNFLTKKTQGPTLQGNFSDEFNNYCIVANNAFENVSFYNISLSNNLKVLGDNVFKGCLKLSTITLPEGLLSIGKDCFSQTSISNIYIPSSVSKLDDQFLGLHNGNIKNIEVSDDNQYYKSIDGNLYSKDGKVLIHYCHGKSENIFYVPDGVEYINDNVLTSVYSYLMYVYFPSSVLYNGYQVFYRNTYFYFEVSEYPATFEIMNSINYGIEPQLIYYYNCKLPIDIEN